VTRVVGPAIPGHRPILTGLAERAASRSRACSAPVRWLKESDWAALRTARLAALAEAPYAFSSTLAREQHFGEAVWRDRTRTGAVYAAWSAAAIVGMATGRPADDGAGWELVGMWVSPDWRGSGVADRLVDAICEHARRAAAGRIRLWVTEVNQRARAMYARLGFAPTGARQLVRPDEPDHWELELARELARQPC
jgi:ribosomal protein S18 acetylase RimI-like enzyme